MTDNLSGNEELLQFFYQMPIALVQITASGDVEMMTPVAVALLMVIARGPLDNLFLVMNPLEPEFQQRIKTYPDPRGLICDSWHIPVKSSGLILSVRIDKVNANRFMVVFQDVTEEVLRAERARQQNDQLVSELSVQLEYALTVMDVSILNEDLEQGLVTVTSRSREWQHLQGKPSGLKHSELVSYIHENDRVTFAEDYRQACWGMTRSFRDFRLRLAHGKFAWITGRCYLTYTQNGAPARLHTLCFDATGQRKGELARIVLAERLNLATSSAGVGIFDIARDETHFWWSDQMYVLHGCSSTEDQSLDMVFKRAISAPDRHRIVQWWRSGWVGASLDTLEYEVTYPSGEQRWLACKGKVQYDGDGEVSSLIGVVWDITEQRTARNALDAQRVAELANKAKSNFLANMSHEIRTPMNVIIGLGHLLSRSDLTDSQQDYLTKMTTAAGTLLQLINDILDFSKIEAGKVSLTALPFALWPALKQVENLMEHLAEVKGLKLITIIHPQTPEYLVGDNMRLQQILFNLLGNAIKFTHSGEIRLEVRPLTCEDEGVVPLQFIIEDTGVGMTAEQLEYIFQPFVQGEHTTARTYGGTGLGLSICHSLVELMGGTISVSSTPGQGSVFTVTITLPWGERAELPEEPEPMGDFSALKGRHILVAEDHPLNQQVISKILEDFGIVVTLADNGEEAVLAVANPANRFDAILMDITMPFMDGYEAARRIRQLHGCQKLPIIALTARATEEDRAHCFAAGMVDHLAKPINVKKTMKTLVHWIAPAEKGDVVTVTRDAKAEALSLPVSDNSVIRVATPSATAKSIDIPTLMPLLTRMHELLAHNNMRARTEALPLGQLLRGTTLEAEARTLEKALARFDYKGARDIVAVIASTLNIGLP